METLDQTLQYICGTELPFRGIPVILSGAFQPTLPVMPGGTMYNQNNALLKSSHLWNLLRSFHLVENFRIKPSQNDSYVVLKRSTKLLLQLGTGNCIQVIQLWLLQKT